MVRLVRLLVRRKIIMRALALAGGLAYIWAVIAKYLMSPYVAIPVAILIGFLYQWGDKLLIGSSKKWTKQPTFYVKEHKYDPITKDWLELIICFKNNSRFLFHISNLRVRGNYKSLTYDDDHVLGQDELKINKFLRYGKEFSVTARFPIIGIFKSDLNGASGWTPKNIPLTLSLDWDTKLTRFEIPINYFSYLEYNNFPNGVIK